MSRKNKDQLSLQKENWKTKFKRSLLIFLSSLTFGSAATPATIKAETTPIENDVYSKVQNDFENSLKVNLVNKNESLISSILKNRDNDFSLETGNNDKVITILQKTFDKIDENFDRNASIRGNSAMTKEQYKNKFADLICDLNDIVFIDKNNPKQDQYTEYFKKRKKAVAFYTNKDITNDLGTIPANTVVMRDGKDLEYTFIHELTHKTQGKVNRLIYSNYNDIMLLNKEGHSNNLAEYIRDTNLEYDGSSIEDYSLTNYKLPTILYNKLSYLIGENEMDNYMQHPNQCSLLTFLSKNLDEKYGKDTGLQFYECISKLSLWFDTYSGKISKNKIVELSKKIDSYNQQATKRMEGKEDTTTLAQIININNNMKDFLKILEPFFDHNSKHNTTQLLLKQLHKNLKEIEILSLNCIQHDIDRISNSKEALAQIQQFDYYRHRCAISKTYATNAEITDISEHFKQMRNIQTNLYNKSVEVRSYFNK